MSLRLSETHFKPQERKFFLRTWLFTIRRCFFKTKQMTNRTDISGYYNVAQSTRQLLFSLVTSNLYYILIQRSIETLLTSRLINAFRNLYSVVQILTVFVSKSA